MPNQTIEQQQIADAIAALPKATSGLWYRQGTDKVRIRSENGFIWFFCVLTKYPNQLERYKQEVEELEANIRVMSAAPALARRVVELESDLAALRSLVRRMREALTGNSLWPAEVDALCAEADKALDPHGSEGGGA